ncbi:unnamed protein product [Larinioides sclopetarius]
MMSQFGARLAFRVMGLASGAMLIVYGVVYYPWLRRKEREYRKHVAAEAAELELHARNALPNNIAEAGNCTGSGPQTPEQTRVDGHLANNSNHNKMDDDLRNVENNQIKS